jgi:DNA repair exonuclease SbcCD ATPase subunit
VEQIRNELLDFQIYKSLRSGTADFLTGSFEKIAKLNNTDPIASKYEKAIKGLDSQINMLQSELDNMQDSDDIEIQEQNLAEAQQLEQDIQTLQEEKEMFEEKLAQEGGMTEAMKAGMADSRNDNEYKKRAEDAIKKMKRYEELFKETQRLFNYGDKDSADLAQHAFELKIKADSNRAIVDRQRQEINEFKEDVRQMAEVVSAEQEEIAWLTDLVEIQSKIDGMKQSFGKNTLTKELSADPDSTEYKEAINKLMQKYPKLVKEHFKKGSTIETLHRALRDKYEADLLKQGTEFYDGKIKQLIKQRDELFGKEIEGSTINKDVFKE